MTQQLFRDAIGDSQQQETLREQSERISGLATSLIASNHAKRTFFRSCRTSFARRSA